MQSKPKSWKRETFLKLLLVVKEICKAFGLLVNKVVKFTEAFSYAITSAPLAVVVLNPTLYWPDRSRLRNYIVSLPKSSSHSYP